VFFCPASADHAGFTALIWSVTMRLLVASLLMTVAGAPAYAQSQQQCEALARPVEAKMAPLQQRKENAKPTPQDCAQAKEVIKAYIQYQAQADKLNCPFAFVGGQKIGGAAERADLLADIKKDYSENCR
jgi:hypothetical protein